jgi:tRNA (cmo5U34)-methyltransferase
MTGEWDDQEVAQSWTADPMATNPLRAEHLDILLSLLEDEYRPGKAIIDIGMGSGLVEELIFQRIPDAFVVGVDGSEPMLELAWQRLAPYEGHYEGVKHDLTKIDSLQLSPRDYQLAISVQTLCNLADEHKLEVFKFLHRVLAEGGLFILLDRMGIDTPGLFGCYKMMWQRLNRIHGSRISEGETLEEHKQIMLDTGGLTATPEQHLHMLREAGFEAACLYIHANRALFAARVPSGRGNA